MKLLIVSGGYTDFDFAIDLIKKSGFEIIIAADSGLNFFKAADITPDVVVGDFDSVNQEVLSYYRDNEFIDFHVLNPEKDDTDTEYAIRFAIEKGADSITILGGTGTRLDHVMGNITLLGIGIEYDVSIEMIDAFNRIRVFNKSFTIKKEEQFGKYISLIPFMGPVKGVTIKGMKYCLDNYDMSGFNSLGISNEKSEDIASVEFEDGIMLVIESRDY